METASSGDLDPNKGKGGGSNSQIKLLLVAAAAGSFQIRTTEQNAEPVCKEIYRYKVLHVFRPNRGGKLRRRT